MPPVMITQRAPFRAQDPTKWVWGLRDSVVAAVIQPPMAIGQMSLADLSRGARCLADVCLVLCDLPWCHVNRALCLDAMWTSTRGGIAIVKMWTKMWFVLYALRSSVRCQLWFWSNCGGRNFIVYRNRYDGNNGDDQRQLNVTDRI